MKDYYALWRSKTVSAWATFQFKIFLGSICSVVTILCQQVATLLYLSVSVSSTMLHEAFSSRNKMLSKVTPHENCPSHHDESMMSGICSVSSGASCCRSGGEKRAIRRQIPDPSSSSVPEIEEELVYVLSCLFHLSLSFLPAPLLIFSLILSSASRRALLPFSSCSQSRSFLSSLECLRLSTRRWSWKERERDPRLSWTVILWYTVQRIESIRTVN